MKQLIGYFVLAVCISAPSFGAEHVLSRSAKVISKDSYKVTKASVITVGKGGDAALKRVF